MGPMLTSISDATPAAIAKVDAICQPADSD